jgi:hypothetical protein
VGLTACLAELHAAGLQLAGCGIDFDVGITKISFVIALKASFNGIGSEGIFAAGIKSGQNIVG